MRLECHVFFLLLALSVTITVASQKAGRLADVWAPIDNVNDPHVVDIARFAVTEHNKQSAASRALKLEKIIKGYTQLVVDGIKYQLILTASPTFSTSYYEAIVLEKPRQDFRSLISFLPIHD